MRILESFGDCESHDVHLTHDQESIVYRPDVTFAFCNILVFFLQYFLTKTHEDVSSRHVDDVHVGGCLHVGLGHNHHQHQHIASYPHLEEIES